MQTVLTMAAAVAVLGTAGCTSEVKSSNLSGIEQSFATLVELFKAPEPDMKAYAASAKSFSENPEAMAYLEGKAWSDDEDERAVTADVLGEIKDEKAVITLTSMVNNDSKHTRKRVYIALQNQNTDEARVALAQAVRRYGPESGLAEAICEVMDPELWSATSEMIILSTKAGAEGAFDPEVIHALISRAKDHEFEVSEFDSEAFELRMAEFAKEMEARFGEGAVEGEWDDDKGHDDDHDDNKNHDSDED